MDSFNGFLLTLDGYLGSSSYFPFILLGVGLFFTMYLGFPQFRFFSHAWNVLRGKYEKPDDPGDTSHFQALSTALSGTVGTGNIGGVGLAIYIGGPTALFWMWVTAFLGMATKFVEVTLSHEYRVKAANGTMSGGPMYYMERGLNMRWLAIFFAIATVICSFGTGNLPQINSIAVSMQSSFGLEPIITGAVLAVLLFLVIVGGIKRIAKVAAAIVPTMATFYLIGALSVILMNYQNIVPSFISIFSDLFTGSSATGGFLGASFAYAFNRGVNRGLFSNEAGQGSAPIAHASAKADEHVSEGMVSLLEPFIDTIFICTITGLVILSSGVWTQKFDNEFQTTDLMIVNGVYSEQNDEDRQALFDLLVNGNTNEVEAYNGTIDVTSGLANNSDFTVIHARSIAEGVAYFQNGELYSGAITVSDGLPTDSSITLRGKSLLHSAALTTMAFTYGFFGQYGQYIVSLSLVLFAFSTAIAWSYYGDRAIIYLVGFKYVLPYRIVYCVAFFVAAFTDTTIVWNFAAVAIVLMTLPNLFGIMMMRKNMKRHVEDYWKQYE
ncbi:MAG: amino acid carrier protein [Gammaproteobacteria bacterium]|nr:amino acid carrier protein [Gammaproteobacteria bacterium]MBT6042068.1 amino acid carrier protein [Gammaproteobacteria bacterium]